jgi:hypothetical protein
MHAEDFTGTESPTDVLNAVLADFSMPSAEIIYEGNLPFLTVQDDIPTDYVCKYRLDKLLLPLFPQCEELIELYTSRGIVSQEGRDVLLRTFAYVAMTNILSRLVLYQSRMFLESEDEARFIAKTILVQSITKTYSKPEKQDSAGRSLSLVVRQTLDEVIEAAVKRRRDDLAGFLNLLPLLTVPMGEGRPKGSTKPLEVKQREKAEFEKKIEETIRSLFEKDGKVPTKTAVAEALGMGGVNPRRGGDSRLNSFNNKLGRFKIEYDTIVQRLNLHE